MTISNGDLTRYLTQFNKAKGYTIMDLESSEYMKEFIVWLKHMDEISKEYIKTLKRATLFEEKPTFEIGKSYLDVISLDCDTTILTQFKDTFPKKYHDRVYEGEFRTVDGAPKYLSREENISLNSLPTDAIYMFNNPYNLSDIDNVHNLEANNVDFICGMFGNFDDCDSNEKIGTLSHLKRDLDSDPILRIEACGTDYFAYIASNPIVRKLTKKE